MADVDCSRCGQRFDAKSRAAGISVFVMGDERIDSWYFCGSCDAWTVEEFYDAFIGDSTIRCRGPLPREAGDRAVAIIRRCATPMDKWCECAAHQEYGL